MPGVEQMEFEILQIAFIWISAFRRKNRIVLSPDNQSRRLIFAEICLPLRIKRRVRAVTVEKLELNVLVARAIHQSLVERPGVGRNAIRVAHAVRVLPFRGVNS